jgi:hypothetical protein
MRNKSNISLRPKSKKKNKIIAKNPETIKKNIEK